MDLDLIHFLDIELFCRAKKGEREWSYWNRFKNYWNKSRKDVYESGWDHLWNSGSERRKRMERVVNGKYWCYELKEDILYK